MASLILLVLFSFLMAFFATENTTLTNITFAGNTFTAIPVYMVVMGALLFGIVISWIIHLMSSLSHSMTIHGKESELKSANAEIKELKKQNENLNVEIAHLKGQKKEVKEEKNEVETVRRPSIFERLRTSFG